MLLIRSKWRTLLKAATSESAVLVLIRSFFAAWTHEELSRIPPDIARRRYLSAQDVTVAVTAIADAHARFRGEARDLMLLQEVLLFMTQASVRIVQLRQLMGNRVDVNEKVATEPEEGIGGPVPGAADQSRPVTDSES